MDDEDQEAMEWIEWNTHPSARFVALGDAAEYLPYLTDRTILVGPWGVEWESTEAYYHQMSLYDDISACQHSSCLSYWLAREQIRPDYIYVPNGDYTVRGKEYEQSATMKRSLENSERYDIVYENEGVIVARVIELPSTPRPIPGEPLKVR